MPISYQRQMAPDLPGVDQPQTDIQAVFVAGVIATILGLTWYIWDFTAWQQAKTFLMGGLLGYVLFRATFGFTGPWRNLIVSRRGMGTRKTLVMLGAAGITMMLLGAYGGYPQVVHPVGWALIAGAFMFGVGMQLGGCCGSGTAWVAGSGSARVAITLVFFILGSVIGSLHAPSWWLVPTFTDRVSMVEAWGVWGAIGATLAILAAGWALTVALETRRHGSLQGFEAPAAKPLHRVVFGPWPPYLGGALMGVLAGLVLVVTYQPWGITFGYTVYGAKIATALGLDLTTITAPFTDNAFWSAGWTRSVLDSPLWYNNAANMNIGIMLGAALAAGLVGKWRPSLKGVGALSLLAAAIGGILMGYGARISTGCNIGAMVNGIASGSLHGWAWMAAAFAGNILGVWLRPRFSMSN